MEPPLTGHARIDQRSIALHRAVADKLSADPGLLRIATANLDRWYPTSGAAAPYLDTWRKLLDLPLEELLRLMVDQSEQMTALRQSSPFAGVLTPPERWAIYARFARPAQ